MSKRSHDEGAGDRMDVDVMVEEAVEEAVGESTGENGTSSEMVVDQTNNESSLGTKEVSNETVKKRPKSSVKKPLSAWGIYVAENTKNGVMSMAECGVAYKNISQTEKERLEKMASDDKVRYLKEISECEDSLVNLEKSYANADSATVFNRISTNNYGIPVARVKNTMKLDPEVKNIAKEATIASTKCVEMFIAYMALRASKIASTRGAKTVAERDILQLIHTNPTLEFLQLDFPLKPNKDKVAKVAENKAPVSIPTGMQSITGFFNAKPVVSTPFTAPNLSQNE